MSQLGCSTRILVIAIIIVLILTLVSFITGAIGSKLVQIEALRSLSVSSPHVELPAEPVTKPLFSLGPLGEFYINNTYIASWLTIIVLVGFFYVATRKAKIIPGRLQSLAEGIVETLLNFVEDAAGKENGRRFFPIVATIFLFVIMNAYLALLPFFGPGIVRTEHEEVLASTSGVVASVKVEEGARVEEGEVIYILDTGEEVEAPINGAVEALLPVGASVTAGESVVTVKNQWPLFRSANTDLNMPLAFALMAVIFVEYWGMRALGTTRYLTTVFFNFASLFRSLGQLFRGKVRDAFGGLVTGIIEVFVGFLELLSHGVRIISFTFRLFGNMTAGEILLLVVVFLVPWIVAIPFYGLELLIGFVQALIFAGLTLVFAIIAVTPHGEEEHT